MARKVFFLLWMTIWPILALFPALITGQTAKHPQAATPNTPITLAQGLSPESPAEITENLPDAEDKKAPQLTNPDPFVNEGQPRLTRELTTPESDPIPSVTVAQESPPPTSTRPSATATHSIRRTGPTLTAQEEHAQKLIHERAQLRAQDRHARLEFKYRRSTGVPPMGTAARWHAQLTQPNWVAGSRSNRKP